MRMTSRTFVLLTKPKYVPLSLIYVRTCIMLRKVIPCAPTMMPLEMTSPLNDAPTPTYAKNPRSAHECLDTKPIPP